MKKEENKETRRRQDKFKLRTGLIYQEDLQTLGQSIDDVVNYYTQITEQIYKGMYILISPLHTPDDEKPHYHVYMDNNSELPEQDYAKLILQFKTKKDYKGVVTQLVKNGKKMRRYLLHLDNPEKQQFPKGASDLYYINCQRSEIEQDLRSTDEIAMITYVYDYLSIEGAKNSVRDYIQYCMQAYTPDIYREIIKYTASHSYFITQILKG